MKYIPLLIVCLLILSGCKKELQTPCGNEVDAYTFPHSTQKASPFFICNYGGDRPVNCSLYVYKQGQIKYRGYRALPGLLTDSIPYSRVLYNADTTRYFTDTVHYDSVVMKYYPWTKVCVAQPGNPHWDWQYLWTAPDADIILP